MTSGTAVSSGGTEVVIAGGLASGTAVGAGAVQVISSGGIASGTLLAAAGFAVVSAGGRANGTVVGSGANLAIAGAGATASGTVMNAGATVTYAGSGTGLGTVVNSGVTLVIGSSGTTTLDVINSGGVEVVQFGGLVSSATVNGGGRLVLSSGSFADSVSLTSGAHRPIRWLGRRAYVGRFMLANPGVQPARFRAGSLGGGLPRRDLPVSSNHAMLLDGVLVPAGALVNGDAIVQERTMGRVGYVHVELDSHDVLLAEGAPSESFVDDNSRGTFHNVGEWTQLYPDHASVPAPCCAPRVESGTVLDAVRRRLGGPAGHQAAVP